MNEALPSVHVAGTLNDGNDPGHGVATFVISFNTLMVLEDNGKLLRHVFHWNL